MLEIDIDFDLDFDFEELTKAIDLIPVPETG